MGRRKKKGENDSQTTPRDDASISGEDQKQILQSALDKLNDSFIRIPPMPSLGISEKDSLLQSFLLNVQRFADDNPLDENESEAMRKGFGALDLNALLKDVDADNERMALDLVAKGFLDPRENSDNWRIIALQVGCSPDAFREDIYEAAVAYRFRLDDTKSLSRDDSKVDPPGEDNSTHKNFDHSIDDENRILYWFGETFGPLDRNPFEVVSMLYEAFKKGESYQWVSLEAMRSRLPDTRALDRGLAEVFTLRGSSKTKGRTVRCASKHPVYSLIESRGSQAAKSYRLRPKQILD